MPEMFPGDDGFGETKSWDRASIGNRSAKPYRPDVKAEDLLLPTSAGGIRTFLVCSLSAFAMTILYIFFPLLILNILVPLGRWFGVVLLGSFLGLLVALTAFSVYEKRYLRLLAADLARR